MDRNDKMIAIGLTMVILGGIGYWFLSSLLKPRGDFEVSNAKYYTDFDETAINLNYRGSSPVNVKVYKEFYFDGPKHTTASESPP